MTRVLPATIVPLHQSQQSRIKVCFVITESNAGAMQPSLRVQQVRLAAARRRRTPTRQVVSSVWMGSAEAVVVSLEWSGRPPRLRHLLGSFRVHFLLRSQRANRQLRPTQRARRKRQRATALQRLRLMLGGRRCQKRLVGSAASAGGQRRAQRNAEATALQTTASAADRSPSTFFDRQRDQQPRYHSTHSAHYPSRSGTVDWLLHVASTSAGDSVVGSSLAGERVRVVGVAPSPSPRFFLGPSFAFLFSAPQCAPLRRSAAARLGSPVSSRASSGGRRVGGHSRQSDSICTILPRSFHPRAISSDVLAAVACARRCRMGANGESNPAWKPRAPLLLRLIDTADGQNAFFPRQSGWRDRLGISGIVLTTESASMVDADAACGDRRRVVSPVV